MAAIGFYNLYAGAVDFGEQFIAGCYLAWQMI